MAFGAPPWFCVVKASVLCRVDLDNCLGCLVIKLLIYWSTTRITNQSFFFFNDYSMFIYLFYLFYLWLCWVFVSVRGLSLVVASGGHSSSRCAGLSLSRPLLQRSTGSRRAGSVIVAHGPSHSAACGIFPDQGSNPCPLHWQADSQPLRHQGSPRAFLRLVLGDSLIHLPHLVCKKEKVQAVTSGMNFSRMNGTLD